MSINLDAFRVVLVEPRNPLNIGAAARAMSNFGFLRLRVVNPYEVAYAEARSAVNASAVLEASEQYPSVAEAVADCSLVVGTASRGHRLLEHPFVRLEAAASSLCLGASRGPVALLFGSEKFGLGNDDLAHCHSMLHIPTRSEHESMNLGQAVAVCLYELVRSDPVEAAVQKRPARGEDLERLTGCLVDALNLSGYIQPRAASSQNKVRRLLHRLTFSDSDARLALGMMRQILWKLRQ